MRKFTEYEEYLYRVGKYEDMPKPEWIDKAKMCYAFIDGWTRYLYDITRDCCMSKSTIRSLSELEMISNIEDIPCDLRKSYEKMFHLVKEMYNVLMENKEQNFVCEWTLSKLGRKVIRQYRDKMRYAYNFKVPQNNFTSEDD